MKRRQFLSGLVSAGTLHSAVGSRLSALALQADAAAVTRVLVMFKCHLDVGFVDTQAAIMRLYFDHYFPKAIDIGEQMSQAGGDRYVWTTGSWMLYEYLEQASAEQRKRAEKAIAAGHLAWHALPFTWQSELLDRTMIAGAIGFSRALDQRYGRTTSGAKMTDVPGHTRGIIAPLQENGVTFLHIGINSASTPAEVPRLFVWKDTNGGELTVMYHPNYGGTFALPGSGLAVAIEVKDDNGGPHTPRRNCGHLQKASRDFSQRDDQRIVVVGYRCGRRPLSRAVTGTDPGDRGYLDPWRAQRSYQGEPVPGGCSLPAGIGGRGKAAPGRCGGSGFASPAYPGGGTHVGCGHQEVDRL